MEVKQNNCPVCLKENINLKFLKSHQEYSLYQCSNCGVQHWQPFKNPGAEWYMSDERYAGRNVSLHHPINKAHKIFIRNFKNRPGKLLDIGCGTGEFLVAAKKVGFEVFGLDFDSDAINKAKENYQLSNLEAISATKYTQKYPVIKFKYITFFDLLEHLDNPKEFILQQKQMLSEGGCIALTTPDRHLPQFFKPHDLPPRHLTRWDKKSIIQFFNDCGFDILELKRMPISFHRLSLKIKFRLGRLLNWGITAKVEKKLQLDLKESSKQKKNLKITLIRNTAKIKDIILFLIPSLFIYLYLLLINKQSLTIYLVAKKTE